MADRGSDGESGFERGSGFEDRFYRRQRAEILDRIARAGSAAPARGPAPIAATRRAARRAALPLAAALLLVALLAGVVALRGPGTAAPAASVAADDDDWLFAWELPPVLDGADPLDGFGPETTEAWASDDPADELDDVLPPLHLDELEEENNG